MYSFLTDKGKVIKKPFDTILEALAYAEKKGYVLMKGETEWKKQLRVVQLIKNPGENKTT